MVMAFSISKIKHMLNLLLLA